MGLDARNLAGWHCQWLSDVTATRLAAFPLDLPEVFKNLTDDILVLVAILISHTLYVRLISSALRTQFQSMLLIIMASVPIAEILRHRSYHKHSSLDYSNHQQK